MIISELIKMLEANKSLYGDIKVETRAYEELVLVIEGEKIKKIPQVEYIPIMSETIHNPNAKRIGLKLDTKDIVMRE